MKKNLTPLAVVLAVAGVGLGFIALRTEHPSAQTLLPAVETANSTIRPVPAGMREYRNPEYHFSFFYPDDLSVRQYGEGGGAAAFTFQNPEKGIGLQIFVMPYTEAQISDARFTEDNPSGVRANVASTTVDGVPAVTFNSSDATLGDTKEVWFIHGGYLFEITTLKSLDGWLAGILEMWRFSP